MKRLEFLRKYNISVNLFKSLVRHGHIIKNAHGYEDNPEFFATFNEAEYLLQLKKQKSFNIQMGLFNMTEEAKQQRLSLLCSSQKIAQNNASTKEKKSKSMISAFQKINKDNFKAAIKAGWERKSKEDMLLWSKQCSIRSKLAYAAIPEDKKELHKLHISKSLAKRNFAVKESGYYLSNDWLNKSKEIQKKIYTTKKENCSFNSSRSEHEALQSLQQKFDDVQYQYRSNVYPYNCDFYIPLLDLYIECNFHWTHGGRPFNFNDISCLEQLNKWKEKAKSSKFYQNAIYVWSVLDIRKRQYAMNNNLNWLCFYTIEEFKQWIMLLKDFNKRG